MAPHPPPAHRHLATRAPALPPRGSRRPASSGADPQPRRDEREARARWAGRRWRCAASSRPRCSPSCRAARVLAIAADIRTHEHIEYTPAPDIVHESAGHAPSSPTAATPSTSSAAARWASGPSPRRGPGGLRGDPQPLRGEGGPGRDARRRCATPRSACGRDRSCRYVSESTRASRLYWWTAEYGLVGPLDAPRIYGAGLLSSHRRGGPLPHARGAEAAAHRGLRGRRLRHHADAAAALRGARLRARSSRCSTSSPRRCRGGAAATRPRGGAPGARR